MTPSKLTVATIIFIVAIYTLTVFYFGLTEGEHGLAGGPVLKQANGVLPTSLVTSVTGKPQPSSELPAPQVVAQNPPTAPTTAVVPSTTASDPCASSITPANTWQRYTNTKYGFMLSLDSLWKGYDTAVVPNFQGTDETWINFRLPGSDETPSAPAGLLLTIVVVPTTSWREMLPLGGPSDYSGTATFIGSNPSYIFGYILSDDTQNVPQYQCEVQRVLQTFEPVPIQG